MRGKKTGFDIASGDTQFEDFDNVFLQGVCGTGNIVSQMQATVTMTEVKCVIIYSRPVVFHRVNYTFSNCEKINSDGTAEKKHQEQLAFGDS